MAVADNAYSRIVSVLKVVLPMGALILLATLFLFARAPITNSQIPFAEIEEIARDQRVSDPELTGVTEDGAIIAITATTARPDGDLIHVEDINAEIDATDGTDILITAGTGQIDTATQIAILSGLTRLTTSSGYVMETDGMTANLELGEVVSDGELEIQAPYGTLTAGRVTYRTEGGTDGGAHMVFNEGVRLVYEPSKEGADE